MASRAKNSLGALLHILLSRWGKGQNKGSVRFGVQGLMGMGCMGSSGGGVLMVRIIAETTMERLWIGHLV